jgi:hypothetical protein
MPKKKNQREKGAYPDFSIPKKIKLLKLKIKK